MSKGYVHGYDARESRRLQDQAATLVELLHWDTAYPEGHCVLEVGCGVGAQTVTLARNSPKALITSIDISETSLAEARKTVETAGLSNVTLKQGIYSICHLRLSHSTTCFCASFLSTWLGRRLR